MKQRKYQALLESIINSKVKQEGDFLRTAELATQLLFQQFGVSYAGVSLLCCDTNQIDNIASFGASSVNPLLRPAPDTCPQYICELKSKRVIDAIDVYHDCRFNEFDEEYFAARDINSCLDIAIRINGRLEGVLFLESEAITHWADAEIDIASQVADQLALTLATRNNYDKDERLTLYKSATDQSEQISIIINLETDLVEYVNQAYETVSKLPKDTVIGHSFKQLDFISQHLQETANAFNQVKDDIVVKGELEVHRADGSVYWLKYSLKKLSTQLGHHFALISAEDCTTQRQYQARLEHLAWRCGLTGLFNRRYFIKDLEGSQSGLLILIDLQGFKHFNDTYGHRNGDTLLIEIARRLKHFSKVNGTERLARLGSDEFAIILPDATHHDIEYLTTRLYRQLIKPVTIGREKVEPRPAMAIVAMDKSTAAFSPLTCADIALQYAQKKQGDAIQIFNNSLLNAFKEDAEIERDLHTALRGREFELYYQPLRDLKKQQYIGAEALIRWHHPKKGVLYPGAFIDIAEKSGLINAIGSWVLEAACRQLNLWQHHCINISMHVNVSARQFFSGQLYEQVWELVTRYRLKPNTLILEITETELMEDMIYATNLCKELTELGVGLAIDDFGTGYSSMRYLKQFPISKLKIDRSFISDLMISRESREIVSAIIAMASALNISLTAEGVETKEQEQFLSEDHCDQAQGFLYSPALREAEFKQFIKMEASLVH